MERKEGKMTKENDKRKGDKKMRKENEKGK